jgi:hypothetical protein
MATFILTSAGIGATQTANFQRVITESEQGFDNGDLGLPVQSFFEFKEGSYTNRDNNQVSFNGVRLTTVLVNLTQSKNIVMTPINGRNGTVKEYVSDGDFVIEIFGKVVNKNNIYPTEAVRALKELKDVPQAIEINCPYLQTFDISNVVITDFEMNETEGFRNSQEFRISMVSDTIIELEDL